MLSWSAPEVLAWERHFQSCPPGDWRAQYLLAEVASTLDRVIYALVGGKFKPRSALEIAPWLESPELKKLKEAKKRRAHLARALSIARGDG